MPAEPVESFWLPLLFLVTLFCSLVLLSGLAWQWWRRISLSQFQWLYLPGISLLALAVATDLFQSRRWPDFGLGNAIVQVLVAVSLVGCVIACGRLLQTHRIPEGSRWSWGHAGLLLLFAVGAAYSSARTVQTATAESYSPEEHQVPGFTSPSQKFVGVTDQGREVTLLRWAPKSDQDVQTIRRLLETMLAKAHNVISRADANTRSNCHGWVFTNGRYLLDGSGVARILEDNGYQQVDQPRAEDLVIYRAASGEILHTGLVRGVLDDGTVLVESKWSVGGRYLHLPDDQPYSPQFAYYRTNRRSHVVAMRFRSTTPEPQSTAAAGEERSLSFGEQAPAPGRF